MVEGGDCGVACLANRHIGVAGKAVDVRLVSHTNAESPVLIVERSGYEGKLVGGECGTNRIGVAHAVKAAEGSISPVVERPCKRQVETGFVSVFLLLFNIVP